MKTTAIALLFVVASSLSARAEQGRSFDDRPKISVSGEAAVEVKPDKIVIIFGIQTIDKDINIAKNQNNDILKSVLAAFKECDVKSKNIQTDQLTIQPRYESDYRKQILIGYFVQNTIQVTTDDTAKVEKLVSKALEAGVTQIDGIEFQTTEFKKYREQARVLALKAAKEKAENMAAVFGKSIGNPLQISENYSNMYGGYYSGWRGRGTSGMSQNVLQNVSGNGGEISGSIALGKILDPSGRQRNV